MVKKETETPSYFEVRRILCPDRGPKNWQIIERLASKHPIAIRQIWYLVDYQNFKPGLIFKDGVEGAREWIKRKKGIIREAPNRRQVLGKLREIKLRLWHDMYTSMGTTPEEIARYKPIQTLLVGEKEDNIVVPIAGRMVRLERSVWNGILFSINSDKPPSIPGSVVIYPEQNTPAEESEIPFLVTQPEIVLQEARLIFYPQMLSFSKEEVQLQENTIQFLD